MGRLVHGPREEIGDLRHPGEWSTGQARVTQSDVYLFKRDAELVSGSLGQNGVGAVADLRSAACNLDGPVCEDRHASLGRGADNWETASRHSPADQLVAFP